MMNGFKILKTYLFVFGFFVLSAANSFAQPNISNIFGVASPGGEITIEGSGFGAKNPAEPILWDDFEGGVDGAAIGGSGGWVSTDPTRPGGMYSSFSPYSGRLAAYNRVTGPSVDYKPTYNAQFNTSNYFFNSTDEVYYSYQFRYIVANVNADNYGIVKMGRSNAAPNKYNGPGNIALSSFNPYYNSGLYAFYEAGGSGMTAKTYVANPVNGVWGRHEMYKKNSTPGIDNGRVWVAINNKTAWDLKNIITREADQSFQQTNIILGLEMANPRNDGDVRLYVDDVYVDNTLARVELGNSQYFENCTKKDVQIPYQWNDSAISVKFNSSSFEKGELAYLFIVDRDGNASKGYPITLGGSNSDVPSVTPPLEPAQNLRDVPVQ